MPLGIPLQIPASAHRDAVFAAFGVPDNGTDAFEIGRAESGASCFLQHDPGAGWWISIPLLRAEFLAADIFPSLDAAAISLGGVWETDGAALIDAWMNARDAELKDAYERSLTADTPPLPRMDRDDLAAAHAWLCASPALRRRHDSFVDDIVAFASLETGDAIAATVISDTENDNGEIGDVWVAPLHHVAVVRADGVSLLDLDNTFERNSDGLVRVVISTSEQATKLNPATTHLRSVSLVEVLERDTFARLHLPL